MRDLIKNYIKEELKKLEYVGDKIHLQNVNPGILEEVIGDFNNPYDLNGYDCDYWAEVDDYSIFGTMRFGTAEITLNKGKIREDNKSKEHDEEKELDIKEVIPEEAKNWDTFYFTFGYGQRYYGYYQPIKAENKSKAHRKMFEVYGTKWSSIYDEIEWMDALNRTVYKPLELLYAI